jgi:hypothetical protein
VGDEQRVRQIVVNLLSNAVKFTDAGGTITVTCATAEAGPREAALAGGPWTTIAVADTGIGIAPDQQAAVFEPFVQASQGKTRTHGGTGLGLAISRRLARLMGGDITLRSDAGAGATFTLWLPGGRVVHDADVPRVARPARRARPPAGPDASAVGAGVDVQGDARASERGDAAAPPAPRAGAGAGDMAQVGRRLHEHARDVVDRVVARLPGDRSAAHTRAQLEAHLPTFVADVAQLFVAINEAPSGTWLLTDGMAIQRFVAERHGEQRQHLGWREAELAREFAILGEELERATGEPAGVATLPDPPDADARDARPAADVPRDTVPVLRRLLARALHSATLGYRRAENAAGERSDADGAPAS